MVDALGWLSSAILLATLLSQIYKQWKQGTSKGVSKWLFIGQLATSVGFTIYSVAKGDTVFIVTNSLLTVSAIIGIYIFFHFRKR
jgi:MtN3 and saliva related transmembrane protein